MPSGLKEKKRRTGWSPRVFRSFLLFFFLCSTKLWMMSVDLGWTVNERNKEHTNERNNELTNESANCRMNKPTNKGTVECKNKTLRWLMDPLDHHWWLMDQLDHHIWSVYFPYSNFIPKEFSEQVTTSFILHSSPGMSVTLSNWSKCHLMLDKNRLSIVDFA